MRQDTTASTTPAAGMLEIKPSGCGDPQRCASADAAIALLEQAVGFIESIDDESYAKTSSLLPGGTIGKHFRHVVDHFAATLAALGPEGEAGTLIEYDRRARNVPMETCRRTAIAEIRGVMEELRRAHAGATRGAVQVRVMLSADGTEGEYASTLGREIAFASHHAVHHHAMIVVIAGEHGVRVPDGFGKAPATLKYERSVLGNGGSPGAGGGCGCSR